MTRQDVARNGPAKRPGPLRHRAALRREPRRVKALALRRAAWGLPAREEFRSAAEQARGEARAFEVAPAGGIAARLEAAHAAARQDHAEGVLRARAPRGGRPRGAS